MKKRHVEKVVNGVSRQFCYITTRFNDSTPRKYTGCGSQIGRSLPRSQSVSQSLPAPLTQVHSLTTPPTHSQPHCQSVAIVDRQWVWKEGRKGSEGVRPWTDRLAASTHSQFTVTHSCSDSSQSLTVAQWRPLSIEVRRSLFVVRRSSFVVRRSSFVLRPSSFVLRPSSFVLCRPSSDNGMISIRSFRT